MARFDSISETPPDPIFGLSAQFRADSRSNKCTFITGYYRTETLETSLLESVAEAESFLTKQKLARNYLPIDGDQEYIEEIGKLTFGPMWDKKRICGIQTVGGTGALYLAGRLATHWTDQIAISSETWINHWSIFTLAGLKTKSYPYYENKALQFEKTVEKLHSLPKQSCLLLHTNCHNPTGFDFSQEEWKEIAEVCKKNELFPILDMAYQGFSAELEEDAFCVHLFMEKEIEFALTYTCAKNFSIYGERAGALFIVAYSEKARSAIRSQLKMLARGSYSNPPMHAAMLVKTVLQTPEWNKKWREELKEMRNRMRSIRKDFVDAISEKDPNGNWEALRNGRGLFCLSELSTEAIETLREEKALYLAVDGRINLTGLNQDNLKPFVDAIVAVK